MAGNAVDSGATSSAEVPRGIGQHGRHNKETRPLRRSRLSLRSASPRARAGVVILIGAAALSALLLTSTPSFVDHAAARSIDNSCCAIGATVLHTGIAEISKCAGRGCDSGDQYTIKAGPAASDVFVLSHSHEDQLFINAADGAFVEPNR